MDYSDALDEAESGFIETLKGIWQAATPAQRKQISRERRCFDVRSKQPRYWTATEHAVFKACLADDEHRTSDEVPF
jgi:hypothetical protein